METYNKEMSARDYLRVLFRQKAVVITAVITVTVTVFIGLKLKTPVYQSQVKMLISAAKQIDSPYYKDMLGYNNNIQAALTQSEIVKSNPVIERSVKAIGLYQRPLDYEKNFCTPVKVFFIRHKARKINAKLEQSTPEQKQAYLYRMAIDDLRASIKVEPIRDTNMFTISVSDYSPFGSAILANVVSRSYIIFDLEQQMAELQLKYGKDHPTVLQLKDNIEKMTRSLNGHPLSDIEAIGPASVKIIEQATVPIRPTGIPKAMTLILAVFMSMFLGVMLAFVFEYLDPTFKSPIDIESYLNLSYLGSIPKKADLDSYHDLADQVYLLLRDKNMKSLLIAGISQGEAVTSTVVNLGNYLSKISGHKVLIIDANFRNPSIHKAFKLSESNGLSQVLENKINFDDAVKDLGANLFVLVAGKTALNPITLLESRTMADIIRLAKERYEVVLVDCADLGNYKDSVVLSACLDGVALTVSEGKTRRQPVNAALTPLRQKNVNVLGVILRNRSYVIPQAIYDRI